MGVGVGACDCLMASWRAREPHREGGAGQTGLSLHRPPAGEDEGALTPQGAGGGALASSGRLTWEFPVSGCPWVNVAVITSAGLACTPECRCLALPTTESGTNEVSILNNHRLYPVWEAPKSRPSLFSHSLSNPLPR